LDYRGEAARRYDNGGGPDGRDDPRRYDPRYNGDSGGSAPSNAPGNYDRTPGQGRYFDNRGDDRAYDSRRDDGAYDNRDDYGAWDAAPPREEEDRLSKTPGSNGGGRPYIQPAAPPVVAFNGPYQPGSVVIDTGGRKLYYVISATSAYAYPIAVGRQGFTWTGKEKVSRITDWPDWYPPDDMRKRKPELPKRMLGGIGNPLGVKAIYLGNTLYRIHGTNDAKSIGKAESSGCFRMLNENVLHLASLIHIGTEVNVVGSLNGKIASAAKPSKPRSSDRAGQQRPEERYYDPYPYQSWRSDRDE